MISQFHPPDLMTLITFGAVLNFSKIVPA